MTAIVSHFTSVLLILILALLADTVFGEPRRFHPLVGFGWLTKHVEKHVYRNSRPAGLLAVAILLLPFGLIVALISHSLSGGFLLVWNSFVLYLVIGRKSLCQHALAVYAPLANNNLAEARTKVGFMVSRDTRKLDESAITSATVESVLENGNDAVFGALFWFMVAGAPGALLFRLSNTLDAMWGYKNSRYLQFGWAAARLDDCLNFIPARLTVIAYGLAGSLMPALRCYWYQGRHWKSPNAGPVMAAGAGSLGIIVGGAAVYSGQQQQRPSLGQGRLPIPADIVAATSLVNRAVIIWLVFFAAAVLAGFAASHAFN